MLVMVMVLLNMLVAILMEAYGVVKEDAKNADSLSLGSLAVWVNDNDRNLRPNPGNIGEEGKSSPFMAEQFRLLVVNYSNSPS